jgi:hypothetical protein
VSYFKVGDKVIVLPVAKAQVVYEGPLLQEITISKIEDDTRSMPTFIHFEETIYQCLISHIIHSSSLMKELL